MAVRGRARLRRLAPERQLAVDLGTANTVVYQRGRGVVTFEPSVVAIDERTGDVYAVGAEARRMIGRTPAHIKATRPLRHGVIADFDTTEHMLRYFIRTAFHRFGSSAEVMVCIPSGVTQVERSGRRGGDARRRRVARVPDRGAARRGDRRRASRRRLDRLARRRHRRRHLGDGGHRARRHGRLALGPHRRLRPRRGDREASCRTRSGC